MVADPTREEMLAALAGYASEFDAGEIEEAIYWFAADYHGGQSSNLYEALCASPFRPSPIASGPGEGATLIYEDLELDFG